MAQMFPDHLPAWVCSDPKRQAEVRVYNALQRQLPARYHVFYSFAWVARKQDGRAWDGESDFVIADERGILLLEVKGGGIDRDGVSGQWFSTDRHGIRHEIDPLSQVKNGKFALISKLKNTPAWGGRYVEIGHAVAFPDCGSLAGTIYPGDMPRQIVVLHEDMENLEEKIDDIRKYWAPTPQAKPIGVEGVAVLRSVLSPKVHLPRPWGATMAQQEQVILELTKQQFLIMETLRWVDRVGVAGGAGTGKTLLAIEKARRLSEEGRETLLLCYNRPLADFLRAELPRNEHPKLTVCTFHQLCHEWSAEAGLGLSDPDARRMPLRFYEQDMPLSLLEAVAELERRFDAVVVDEGQDFLPTWWLGVEAVNRAGSRGVLYVFYDDNQCVRNNTGGMPKDLVPVVLERNLRNTVPIFTLGQRFYRGNSQKAGGPEGREVCYIEVAPGRESTPKALSRVLHDLCRNQEVSESEIAILVGDELSSLRHASSIGVFAVSALRHPKQAGIVIESIRRFKGLERPVVILAELDRGVDEQELLYVGVSRARLHLVILAQAATLDFLRNPPGPTAGEK